MLVILPQICEVQVQRYTKQKIQALRGAHQSRKLQLTLRALGQHAQQRRQCRLHWAIVGIADNAAQAQLRDQELHNWLIGTLTAISKELWPRFVAAQVYGSRATGLVCVANCLNH